MANWRRRGYRGLHNWVERELGKPSLCAICGDDYRRMYHWANISGEYKRELSDWRRLCVPCHKREKYLYACVNGHKLDPENVITRRRKNTRGEPYDAPKCRQCAKEQRRKYYLRERGMMV